MFRTSPANPDQPSLEAGQAFQGMLQALDEHPRFLFNLMRDGPEKAINFLREREVQFRRIVAQQMVDGQRESEAVEIALDRVSLQLPEENPKLMMPPGHEERMRSLRRFVQSAPRTWPPAITVSKKATT